MFKKINTSKYKYMHNKYIIQNKYKINNGHTRDSDKNVSS